MRRTWIAIGTAIVLAGTLPATTSASQRVIRTAQMKLAATNGYKAYAFASHQLRPRRHAEVAVAVYEDNAYASYSVPALFTKRHLKARLGQFGRINVRIHRKQGHGAGAGPRRLSPAESDLLSSKRSPRTAKRGHPLVCFINGFFHHKAFRGRIRFEAENGYTAIHADRATGSYFDGSAACPRGKPAHGTFLRAESDSVKFFASHYKQDPRNSYLYAAKNETAGRVSITRSASSYGPSVFDFSPDFMTAHVEPSGDPLSGSADFAAPDQWTGDLTASFPGEPPVPLTGPDFTARLKHR